MSSPTTANPVQEEIRCDLKVSSPNSKKLKNPTETCQKKENNNLRSEKKQLDKKMQLDEKEKLSKAENENSTCSKNEDSKNKVAEIKNIEIKSEKGKTEANKQKVVKTAVQEYKMIPIATKSEAQKPSNVAVPRKCPPLSTPLLTEQPLVLTTHLVPSLPIGLFEVLVEAIEVATEKPVVLLYEPRSNRPVAKEIADIAVLPTSGEWKDGELLPVSFCFEHYLNKSNSPCIYADVIVATDRAPHVETINDLRGHRCSLPDRKQKIGAAALLFNYLYARGESPAFFGNTLDADSQVATLQMVAGRQAEIGVLESPVIKCHKDVLPGIESLHILTSLGPLPPYRIMAKKTLADALIRKITAYLLNIDQDKEWLDRFAPYGVTGFAKNSNQQYDLTDMKSVVTRVPYY